MITELLLDIDGTLIDTDKIFYLSLNNALKKNNLPETKEENLFGMSVPQVLEKLNLSHILNIKQEWEEEFSRLSLLSEFYEGIIPMIQKAYELKMNIYLVTSRSHITADPVIQCTKIGPYIKGCIAAEDTKRHKPYPDPILKAIKKYTLNPEQVLYIGDTNTDCKAAMAANINFALAGWNKSARKDICSNVLLNPMDIFNITI